MDNLDEKLDKIVADFEVELLYNKMLQEMVDQYRKQNKIRNVKKRLLAKIEKYYAGYHPSIPYLVTFTKDFNQTKNSGVEIVRTETEANVDHMN
jgi:hypothetical protein